MNASSEMVIDASAGTLANYSKGAEKMNQEIIPQFNGVSITSLEIAELTGKQHGHVIRDIEDQLSEICSLSNFGESYKAQNGQTYKMYRLPKIEAVILVSGYDVKLRAKIIYRLDQLEKQLHDDDNIALLARGHVRVVERVETLESKFTSLQESLPIDHWQQKELLRIKSKKVYSFKPKNQTEQSALERKIGHIFKKRFQLPRYDALPRKLYEEATQFLEDFTPAQLAY